MSQLPDITIAEAAEAIKGRALSPVELIKACLERIDRAEKSLNAFISVLGEQAMREAALAEAEMAGGRWRGPLHGIPIGVKDIIDVAGTPATAASRTTSQRAPAADATVIARLRAAGAIIIGKLNMHELAFGATGTSSCYGPVRNPWNPEHISGGSSSGSAAALAAGECLGALGTDTGGSIRIPAALCGVAGLKPTYGRVSRTGILPLAWSLDHCGPLANTAFDAALLLNAIAGHDPTDPASSPAKPQDYTSGIQSPIRGLRIGIPKDFFYQGVEGEVIGAVEEAIKAFTGQGAEPVEVTIPSASYAPAAATTIIMSEATAYHLPTLRERGGDLQPDVRLRLQAGLLLTAAHYLQAQRVRSLLTREMLDALGRVDVMITPATPMAAPKLADSDSTIDVTRSLTRFTGAFNLTGLPAVSIPCGFTGDGLPLGMQIIGRPHDEATVLRVAHAYQGETDWRLRTPTLVGKRQAAPARVRPATQT